MQTLRQGSRGDQVRQLQQALNLIADGIFGPLTAEAVRDYQARHGLTADGIVGPATWASLLGTAGQLAESRRTIEKIIIHCTASPEGKHYTVDDIRRLHIGQNGWSDIGYHYVIYLDGSVHPGRNVDLIGAHTTGQNARSIGVCYVGGVATDGRTPKDTRTPAQRQALRDLVAELRRLYPAATVHGHNEFAPKACPSFNVRKEFGE